MRVDRAAWDEETSPGSDLHSTGDTPTNEPLGKLIDGLMFNEVQRLQLMLQVWSQMDPISPFLGSARTLYVARYFFGLTSEIRA